jgi:hypothetical protein
MTALFRPALAAALLALVAPAGAQDKEMTDNPFYGFWSKSKVGASITMKETTKTVGPDKTTDEDVKVITSKLVALTKDKAVVETVVTEGEVFGFIESAPTKHIYPAKMSKEVLDDFVKEWGAKSEDTTVTVDGKEYKVKVVTGNTKGKDGDEVLHKVWLSDEVPGTIAKRTRVTKVKGEVVAETTLELVKFSKE